MRDRELVLQVNAQAASEQYRVHNVAEQLDLAGVPHKALTIQQLHDSPEKGNRLFDESTLIIFHRVAYDSLLDRLCTRARKRGTTLVYETDDLIFFPNIDPCWIDGLRYLDHTEVSRYYEGVERYKRMLELCDAGLFSTGFLASIARKMGVRRTWVLRNALGNVFMDASERVCDERKHHHGNARVRLGYCSGTKTHNRDFTVFAPTLLRLMEDDPRLDLEILGHLELPAQFQHFGARVRQHKPVSWEHYLRVYVPQFLSAFDINLAPLEFRNPFCRAKSELKYFEAGILGIPTIASRTEEFAYAIESGKTGFLVNDDRELEDCLRKLASHRDLRIRVGAAAREDVLLRYSPLSRSRDLLEILREITGKELSKRSLEAHVN
jgi:glycosyltransferase involved in cell wall biosynthesis